MIFSSFCAGKHQIVHIVDSEHEYFSNKRFYDHDTAQELPLHNKSCQFVDKRCLNPTKNGILRSVNWVGNNILPEFDAVYSDSNSLNVHVYKI